MKKIRPLFLLLFPFVLTFFITAHSLAEDDTSTAPTSYTFVNSEDETYCLNEKDEYVTSQFVTKNKKLYYFSKSGKMLKDKMFTRNKKTYYAGPKGVIARNKIVSIGSKSYYFNKLGERQTGWFKRGGHTYYATKKGVLPHDTWKKIEGSYYYFTSDFYIRKGKWVDDCYVDPSGKRVIAPLNKNKTRKVINMKNILQNPELPTGCESVALTITLNHFGYNLKKTTIAANFMPRSDSNFVTAFWGNPFYSNGGGIYAPGLTATANKYLQFKKSNLKAYDISGTEFGALAKYIDAGIPVIVWNSMYMNTPVPVYSISALGRSWTFFRYEHCVVLCGYDTSKKQVLINDPLSGLVWRKTSDFKAIYNMLGKMAVVIK